MQRSLHAAYTADVQRVGVSVKALYDKIDHVEPTVAAELVRHTAKGLEPLIRAMGGERPPLLPGYRVGYLYLGALVGAIGCLFATFRRLLARWQRGTREAAAPAPMGDATSII